jgi:hypothetical protein
MNHPATPGSSRFEELFAQARAGCREALGHLLQSHWPFLRRRAAALLAADLRAKASPEDFVRIRS